MSIENVNFISAMPTNLYGTNDNYHPENSHVLPALIRRIVLAKMNDEPNVTIWGTGNPIREFMHVDDCADACVFLMKTYSGAEHVNIGVGSEISIRDAARLIMAVLGHDGELVTDPSKPDGTPRKLMDNSRLTALGWQPKIGLREGIADAYAAFLAGEGRGLQG